MLVGSEEIEFINMFMRYVSGNIPLANRTIINGGLFFLSPGVTHQDFLAEAYITLTWIVCSYGAFLQHNARSEIYLNNALKSLEKLLQKYSFAKELSSDTTYVVIQTLLAFDFVISKHSNFVFLRGYYFNMADEMIRELSVSNNLNFSNNLDCELLWTFLRNRKRNCNLPTSSSINDYWAWASPDVSISENESATKYSHVVLSYWIWRFLQYRDGDEVFENDEGLSQCSALRRV